MNDAEQVTIWREKCRDLEARCSRLAAECRAYRVWAALSARDANGEDVSADLYRAKRHWVKMQASVDSHNDLGENHAPA